MYVLIYGKSIDYKEKIRVVCWFRRSTNTTWSLIGSNVASDGGTKFLWRNELSLRNIADEPYIGNAYTEIKRFSFKSKKEVLVELVPYFLDIKNYKIAGDSAGVQKDGS